jgi:hypothetical protein
MCPFHYENCTSSCHHRRRDDEAPYFVKKSFNHTYLSSVIIKKKNQRSFSLDKRAARFVSCTYTLEYAYLQQFQQLTNLIQKLLFFYSPTMARCRCKSPQRTILLKNAQITPTWVLLLKKIKSKKEGHHLMSVLL